MSVGICFVNSAVLAFYGLYRNYAFLNLRFMLLLFFLKEGEKWSWKGRGNGPAFGPLPTSGDLNAGSSPSKYLEMLFFVAN